MLDPALYDIYTTSVIVLVLLVIFLALFMSKGEPIVGKTSGWSFILIGFYFIFFSRVYHLTRNIFLFTTDSFLIDREFSIFVEDFGILISAFFIAIGVIKWIPKIVEHEKNLQHLAAFDSLTMLPNRRYFEENIEQVVSISKRHGQKFALLSIDIDNFKWINDTFGHDVGDEVLKKLSSLLKTSLRKEDFIARTGGDEFSIILRGMYNYESVVVITDKILKLSALPIRIGSIDVQTTISIGVTLYPLFADNIKTLLKQADLAMYKAKSKGKNCVEFFSEEITTILSTP